ncbi:retrovirus-related pol polyprotein from transposon TNT 1-94 [Tanacetum coccineum]
MGTVRFGNDQFAPILGYGDLIQGNVTIKRVYYVEGLNHNLFSVGQFCDADLEVAFRKSTCFVRDLQGNDLLTGSRGSDLYTISLQETTSSTPICFMAKASPTQAWLWHRRLSHLNFDYITLLSKKEVVNGLPKLKYVKDQLCSSCEMSKAKRKAKFASHGLDETPEVLKDFLTMIQRNLQAQVITVRTDRGTEFLNKTLHAYFKEEGIEHQTSTPRTPEQNGVVERRNRTLVEAARTMLSASKLPLSFWAEAVATACYTQNRSIIISTHEKTAYHIINDRKPSIKHLHIFGCTCYITRDGENLDKMKEKGDPCVMVGYSTQSKGYRVYNKRTRLIVESIHIKFDEIKEMMSDHNSSDLAPQRQEMSVENVSSGLVPQGQKASDYDNSDPMPPRQNVVPTAEKNKSSIRTIDRSTEASWFKKAEFINPFCTRVQEIGESSSHNIDNTDVHSFQHKVMISDGPEIITKKNNVRGNPSMPVQTRRQLATDPEMCMFALTEDGIDLENHLLPYLAWEAFLIFVAHAALQCFIDPDNPEKVYLLRKALYGLKQAPRAWYDELSTFLMSKGFTKDSDHAGCLDTTEKSLSGGIQFLGDKHCKLDSKKQNCTAMSSHSQSKTEYQLADSLPKPLPDGRFKVSLSQDCMRCLTPAELEVLTNESA